MNGVVIFAGGVGSRMGDSATLPKQFLDLAGKPIICRTIEVFEKCEDIDVIAVVCVEDWIPYCSRIIEDESFTKIYAIVAGGATGQESIFNGLEALRSALKDDDVVLVHDGVRPLIYPQTVSECIWSVRSNGVSATVAPAIETILFKSEEDLSALDRSKCMLARAPQGSLYGDLFKAHLDARAKGRNDYIDTVCLMRDYDFPVFMVEGPAENIKVTTPIDYLACVAYYEEHEKEGARDGFGIQEESR